MNEVIKKINELAILSECLSSQETGQSITDYLITSTSVIDVLSYSADKDTTPEISGLYYFEVKFSFLEFDNLTEFGIQWGKIRGNNLESGISRYYPERAKNQKDKLISGEYIPFYLGKSKNIKNRIIEHITGIDNSDTYSLKIQKRPELVRGFEFKMGFLPLDISSSGYFCI